MQISASVSSWLDLWATFNLSQTVKGYFSTLLAAHQCPAAATCVGYVNLKWWHCCATTFLPAIAGKGILSITNCKKKERKTTFGIPKVEYPYKRIDNAKYSLNAMIGISFVYEE